MILRRIVGIAAVSGAAALTLALPASAAWAADATGCSGSVVSMDSSGAVIGKAAAPGDGGTQADPLPIDVNGTVAWKGSTDAVITDATWSVSALGVSFLSGTFANTERLDAAEGVVDLSSVQSVLAWMLKGSMVIPVSGSISGTGGSCSAEGYVTGTGSPTSSPMFFAGAAAAVVGVGLAIGVIAGTKAAGAAGAASATGSGGTVQS